MRKLVFLITEQNEAPKVIEFITDRSPEWTIEQYGRNRLPLEMELIKDEESEVDYEEPEVTDKKPDDYMFTNVPGEQPFTSVGGSRKYKKNLCHKKSVKKPNKCKKVKGCKVATGPKRTFCRKIKNKNNKTQKKSTPFRFKLGERLQGLTKKATKELRKLK